MRRASRTDELAETLAALANAQDGVALLGVAARTRKPEGLPDPEAARLAALDAALACTPPLVLPLPELVAHDGAQLLLVQVRGSRMCIARGESLRRAAHTRTAARRRTTQAADQAQAEARWEQARRERRAGRPRRRPARILCTTGSARPRAGPMRFLTQLLYKDQPPQTTKEELLTCTAMPVGFGRLVLLVFGLPPPNPACCCWAAIEHLSRRAS